MLIGGGSPLGETKRAESPKNSGSGEGKKNLRNLMSKQLKLNKTNKELNHAVRSEITKGAIIKQERQDKIVDVFFKEDCPLISQHTPKHKVKKPQKRSHTEKPKDRGNLSYFLTNSNFKEPKCLSQEKKPASSRISKYNEIDSRLKTQTQRQAPGNMSSFFSSSYSDNNSASTSSQPAGAPRLLTQHRLPPNKKLTNPKPKPEATLLLPYPQDVSTNQTQLEFHDVWKKVETKDIFPHVNR
jgi:hypothetical protein